MLTDMFLDRQNAVVPVPHLCRALTEICVPLAGRCIVSMQLGHGSIPSTDELMIEFELCIGLIFKPLRHHLKKALTEDVETHIFPLWKSVLAVLEELLSVESSEERSHLSESLRKTMHDLATEHLQNAVVMLVSSGVLVDTKGDTGMLIATKASVRRMGISQETLDVWMRTEAEPTG